MSKSILVIDTPENCYCCGFCQDIHGFYYCCGCNDTWYENQLEYEEMNTKPDWCPLKPMPEKKYKKKKNKIALKDNKRK